MLQRADPAQHQGLGRPGDLFGGDGHPVVQPFAQQADAAGAGKGVKILNLPGGGVRIMLEIGRYAPFPPDAEEPGQERLIPVFAEGHGT